MGGRLCPFVSRQTEVEVRVGFENITMPLHSHRILSLSDLTPDLGVSDPPCVHHWDVAPRPVNGGMYAINTQEHSKTAAGTC